MSFKSFDLSHDVASLVSSINEVVSISSSLFSGSNPNVKQFSNIATGTSATALGGYWQTVYDSTYTSQASTALFDITYGYASSSALRVAGLPSGSVDEKTKVYREMASMLLGSADSTFTINNTAQTECFFILVKRGLMKDELKKGAVGIYLNDISGTTFVTGTDTNAATSFKQTIGGDYAPILSGSTEIGQVWYNAGVIIVPDSGTGLPWSGSAIWSGTLTLDNMQSGSTIDQLVNGYRNHINKLNFHNQTNLYSTVYFCRATNTEFNYSSNPTYVDSSQRIRVTSGSNVLQSRTYVTTIGLYDANDNLLAVGKLNKPITKAPDLESIYRIRLDY